MHAARNLNLCTKDCLCLFVCPTKATDTENGQIDFSKCMDGCRLCVDACPSHALYLVYDRYPEPADKDKAVTEGLLSLLERKAYEERMVRSSLAEFSKAGKSGSSYQRSASMMLVLKALQKSLRIVEEDAAREAGYLLPQGKAARALIDKLIEEGVQADALKELRKL